MIVTLMVMFVTLVVMLTTPMVIFVTLTVIFVTLKIRKSIGVTLKSDSAQRDYKEPENFQQKKHENQCNTDEREETDLEKLMNGEIEWIEVLEALSRCENNKAAN